MNTEDLLVAVLHRVGSTTRLANDVRLAKLFNAASQKAPEILGDFAWHPQYHDSKVLRNALQNLDLGGGIVRENASIRHFRVAPRVSGDYGKSKFEVLDDRQREVVDQLADEIRNAFSTSAASA
jgi:hypothetical protein